MSYANQLRCASACVCCVFVLRRVAFERGWLLHQRNNDLVFVFSRHDSVMGGNSSDAPNIRSIVNGHVNENIHMCMWIRPT